MGRQRREPERFRPVFDVRGTSMSKTSTASCLGWLEPLAGAFGAWTWRRALVLVAGALLAQGPCTVASALRAVGLGAAPGFGSYHRVLSRRRWSARAISRLLLGESLRAFVPPGAPVVVGLDETFERRWGRRIAARGIYRDPVRSSRGVNAEAGLVLLHFPCCRCAVRPHGGRGLEGVRSPPGRTWCA